MLLKYFFSKEKQNKYMFWYFFLIFNIILIIIMSIFEIKNIKKWLSWSIIIFIFSILGFLLYIILGNNLKFKAKKQIIEKKKSTNNYLKIANIINIHNYQINEISNKINNDFKCKVWTNNNVKIFTNGHDFFYDLLEKISNAKNHINLEFYIFSDDETGQKLANILIKKAQEKVKIKIIYDSFGSRKTKNDFWENMRRNNIEVQPFFPPLFDFDLLNFKINYRNHRKIAIIDGKIAYIGGINIRNDHMGKDKKLSPWRDTQLMIAGTGVYSIQDIFLNDWAFCTNKTLKKQEIIAFFPKITYANTFPLQIIDDGIEYDKKRILSIYIDIINYAKKYIYIQTPYFLINDELQNAIINAKNRGVNVNIFLPKKPDKKFIFGASLINIKKLLKNKVNIYLYNGFIHSKVLLSDNAVCIGSCNFDYRSLFLNFEVMCICYDKNFIEKNKKIINSDIKNSVLLTKKAYLRLKTKNIFAIFLYKIVSKLL